MSAEILSTVRHAVRRVIEDTPVLQGRPDLGRQIARKMVGVSMAAAELLAEEKRLSEQIAARAGGESRGAAATSRASSPMVLAEAQTASQLHGQSAVNNAANVLRATRDAIDFPGFVTSLINGVFQSIQNSSIQQLQAFSDLMGAVSATTSDFATSQITDARAATWVAGHFPVFSVEANGSEPRLVLRQDAQMPPAEELARVLEATRSEVGTVNEGDLNESLLPLVRRKLARDRQAMLSTMVLMGLQRVVIDDGHIHASMDLRVDARSTAEQTTAEQTDTRFETEASGSFGMGMWGASARMAASVGYVHSDEQHTREDIAVSAGIRSSVDVRFHTEPLDTRRVASDRTLDQLRARALVPDTEQNLHRNLLETAAPRDTARPALPAPSRNLLAGDRTLDEARRAREQQSGANAQQGGGTAGTDTHAGGGTAAGTDTTATAPVPDPAPEANPNPAPAADPPPAPQTQSIGGVRALRGRASPGATLNAQPPHLPSRGRVRAASQS